MSRTKKGTKGVGHEYWSRRPSKGISPGPETKKITRKKERAESKKKIEKESSNTNELFVAQFPMPVL